MKNEYTLSEDGKTAYVKLTQGQFAIINAEDLEKIGEYRWYAQWAKNKGWYYASGRARLNSKEIRISLHRLILGAEKGEVVDHIDGNGLDNRKSNIRICTYSQNSINRKIRCTNRYGQSGVYLINNRWNAKISVNGCRKNIGTFDTFEEAVAARKEYERELHGEFARAETAKTGQRGMPTRRDYLPEEYYSEEYGKVYRVPLTKGQYAIIDLEDYDIVSQHMWHASFSKNVNNYYAKMRLITEAKSTTISLHRFLLSANENEIVDHKNGNTLDDRRCNLRLATPSQNTANSKLLSTNTSGFKGVTWHKVVKKWQALIKINGINHHLGWYDDPQLAYEAYCEAAIRYQGEFARLA